MLAHGRGAYKFEGFEQVIPAVMTKDHRPARRLNLARALCNYVKMTPR